MCCARAMSAFSARSLRPILLGSGTANNTSQTRAVYCPRSVKVDWGASGCLSLLYEPLQYVSRVRSSIQDFIPPLLTAFHVLFRIECLVVSMPKRQSRSDMVGDESWSSGSESEYEPPRSSGSSDEESDAGDTDLGPEPDLRNCDFNEEDFDFEEEDCVEVEEELARVETALSMLDAEQRSGHQTKSDSAISMAHLLSLDNDELSNEDSSEMDTPYTQDSGRPH